jgi:hypothetical protein
MGYMPNIEITDVPADVLAIVEKRAANAGQSLDEYMLSWLTGLAAATPPVRGDREGE